MTANAQVQSVQTDNNNNIHHKYHNTKPVVFLLSPLFFIDNFDRISQFPDRKEDLFSVQLPGLYLTVTVSPA